MIMRDRSNLLKNLLVMGAAGASLLVGLPALSQTSNEPSAPDDIVMSAEGMEILCEVTPLNSRCSGGEQPAAVPPSPEPRESATPSGVLEPQTAPSNSSQFSLPSETAPPSVEPSAPEPSGSMSPGDKPSSDSMEAPGSTPSSTMPPAPKPQSLTAPSTDSPTEATAPSLSPAPSMAPSYSKGTALKGEADSLRTESPAAQAPSAPSAAPSRTPSRTPASSQTPGATPASPQTPGTAPSTATPAAAVSPAELQKFAKVIPQLQEIQKTAQQQVSEAIKKAGLSEDRFRELYSVQQAPQSPPTTQASTPATPQERQAVQQVTSQLETIQSETQTRRVQAVESQGLELTRFNEILTAVRQDADLQQQLQQILSN